MLSVVDGRRRGALRIVLPALDTPSALGAIEWAGRTRLQRFWEKVETLGPDDCWEWRRSIKSGGYGQLGDWRNILGPRRFANPKPIRAHVLSWAIANERWPLSGEVVRHACDNPPCCNPRHLLIGSAADNVRDCRDRKRQRVWAARDARAVVLASEVARVTPQRAAILRALQRVPQPTPTDIAAEHGVSRQAIEQSLVLMEIQGLVRRCRYVVLVDVDARAEVSP